MLKTILPITYLNDNDKIVGIAAFKVQALFKQAVIPFKIKRSPFDTSKITFTSGSTGNPKGVCLSTEQKSGTVGQFLPHIKAFIAVNYDAPDSYWRFLIDFEF